MVVRVVDSLITIYSLLVIIRIVFSFARAEKHPHWSVRVVCRLTDPAMNIARRVVPPIGGTLDVSGFIVLLVLYIIRMIVTAGRLEVGL